MKKFTKNEIFGVSLILALISILMFFNMQIALRRARDSQRRSDIGAISDALEKYQKDFGFFPPSNEDGKILACMSERFGPIPESIKDDDRRNYYFNMLKGCSWGDDAFKDVNDDSYESYLKFIPKDPEADKGYSYFYISNMNRYQIFAYLEGENDEIGYRQEILDRNINCGVKICNFGKAYADTPLGKSIEEFEKSLMPKK